MQNITKISSKKQNPHSETFKVGMENLRYLKCPLVAQLVKNPPAMRETWVRSLGGEDPLEKGKAPHSRILAWRFPWTLQSMRLQRVGYD